MENRFLGGNFEAELNLETLLVQINIYITIFFASVCELGPNGIRKV
jgi:hypothetical protein